MPNDHPSHFGRGRAGRRAVQDDWEAGEMSKFLIRYALGGGFGGCENEEWEEIEAKDLGGAEREAYERAIEVYESYEGLHGLRDVTQIMEEDEVSESEAMQIYDEERESWLDFEAKVAEESI